MEDNYTQEALKRKAQAEADLRRKIDDAMDVMQAKLALAELTRRSEQLMFNPKPFEDFDLHFSDFDDPTDDVMTSENQDLYDEMPPVRNRSGRWK